VQCGENAILYTVNETLYQLTGSLPIKLNIGNIKAFACGVNHYLAVTFDYKLYAWGDNKFGQLGLVEIGTYSHPELVNTYETSGPFKLACGSYFSLVVSYTPPKTTRCRHSEAVTTTSSDCPLQDELSKLRKELETIRSSARGSPDDKRRTRRYLEANPIQFAKAPRTLDTTFEINFDEIALEAEPIGNGGYGTVFKGKWRGTEVAVKKMHLESDVPSDKYSDFINEC
jgi:hypothetical protein